MKRINQMVRYCTPIAAVCLAMAACGGDDTNGPDEDAGADVGVDTENDVILGESGCLAVPGSDDADGDGIIDSCDVCEGDDATGDRDEDGVCDADDLCPEDAANDSDGDGICDGVDVCPGLDDLEDVDGDGYACSSDCDDNDASIFPTAAWYIDADGDGFGAAGSPAVVRCTAPEGYVDVAFDCDDTRASVVPGGPEWCDGRDSDCDALTAEPDGVVHRFENGAWTDVTSDFVDFSGSEYVVTSEADSFTGFCGVSGPFAFDVMHDVEIVGVGDVVFDAVERATFVVGDPEDSVASADASLQVSGITAVGSTHGFISVNGATVVAEDITVTGADTGDLASGVVDAIGATVTIAGLTASGISGRAVDQRHSSVHISNAEFSGFDATLSGGAIQAIGGSLSVTASEFSDTSAGRDGGAILMVRGDLLLRDVEIDGAYAQGYGGGIAMRLTEATFETVDVFDSDAAYAGAVHFADSVAQVDNSDFRHNRGRNDIGGVLIDESVVTMNYSYVVQNRSAGATGGLQVSTYSTLYSQGLGVRGNVAGDDGSSQLGGGVHIDRSMVHLRDATIEANSAGSGAAVYVSDSFFMIDGTCSIQGNVAADDGAALHLANSGLIGIGVCEWGSDSSQYNRPRNFRLNSTNQDTENSYQQSVHCGLSTGCDTYNISGRTDEDGDGFYDRMDLCSGVPDGSDFDGDGVPCRYDHVTEAPLEPAACLIGWYDDPELGCVFDSCRARGLECEVVASCSELLAAHPDLPSGQYVLDIDGSGPLPMRRAVCDMETEGGGWTLVMNYVHDPTQYTPNIQYRRPRILTDRTPLLSEVANDPVWIGSSFAHAAPSVVAALAPTEAIFHAWTDVEDGPTIHFRTSHPGTLDYISTGTGSCDGLQSDFTAFDDHDAQIPAVANTFNPDAGDNALAHTPFYSVGESHWNVRNGDEFWVDDYWPTADGGTPHGTTHRVWVR